MGLDMLDNTRASEMWEGVVETECRGASLQSG